LASAPARRRRHRTCPGIADPSHLPDIPDILCQRILALHGCPEGGEGRRPVSVDDLGAGNAVEETGEIAELAPGSAIDDPVIECGGIPCKGVTGKALPKTVHVYITFDMYDTWFGVAYTGRYGLGIQADVTVPYVGY
jgi:hypothetical protein